MSKPKTKATDLYSIILPTYNESVNLPLITGLIFDHCENLNIQLIIVDDNSPDGTSGIAIDVIEQYGSTKIKLIKRSGKLGLGSAYLAGLTAATGTHIILMDADMSHHPRCIPLFVKRMKDTNCDVVTGTRYTCDGGVCGWEKGRKITSVGANFVASWLLWPFQTVPASDLTGSFRLYKRTVIEMIFPKIISKGYVFQVEVITRCIDEGFKVEEVGICFVDRIYGESKLGVGEIVGFLKGVLKLVLLT